MNDVLKDKLRVIASDELMMRALKEAVFDRIERNKPNINETDNNSVLGQKYRAAEEAKELINGVLTDISAYKEQKSNKKLTNKGK